MLCKRRLNQDFMSSNYEKHYYLFNLVSFLLVALSFLTVKQLLYVKDCKRRLNQDFMSSSFTCIGCLHRSVLIFFSWEK
jgi:hypothetical protein